MLSTFREEKILGEKGGKGNFEAGHYPGLTIPIVGGDHPAMLKEESPFNESLLCSHRKGGEFLLNQSQVWALVKPHRKRKTITGRVRGKR